MFGEPEQYAYEAAIICPDCADTLKCKLAGNEDTGDSDDFPQPDCSGESPRPGETCDLCGDVYVDGDWLKYVPGAVRWAMCRSCNSQYAYQRGSQQYHYARRAAWCNALACPNCAAPTVHF